MQRAEAQRSTPGQKGGFGVANDMACQAPSGIGIVMRSETSGTKDRHEQRRLMI